MIAYFFVDNRWSALVGIVGIICIASALSRRRSQIALASIGGAFSLLVAIAYGIISTTLGQMMVQWVAAGVGTIYQAAAEGIGFVFGNLGCSTGPAGFVFAIAVLPVVIVFAGLMGVLHYYGIVQGFVMLISRLFGPLLGLTGPEAACAVANSFLGQTEAPLLIRPYLATMSRSGLFVVMVSGMGTISGSILVVYAALGIPAVHLLTASVMAIPATILIARIMEPEDDGTHGTQHAGAIALAPTPYSNVLHALAQSALEGLQVALNIGAMLIVFIALIDLINRWLGYVSLNIVDLFHLVGMPAVWCLGMRGTQLADMSSLIGLKIAANEMIAYRALLAAAVTSRVLVLMTYVLCGFSNISSIGIQIGGIGALIPERRALLAELAPRALIAAVLANLLSAYIICLIL